MTRLKDEVAIITGAASGIGAAIAKRFVREGACVVIADRNEVDGVVLADQLRTEFGASAATFIGVDVADASSVERLMAETLRRFGALDILVNNAGLDGEQSPTAESSLENWRRVLDVNLDGVYYGMKYGIQAMLTRPKGGVIVNMASTAGLVGFPSIPAYCASKGGVVQLTRAAAVEYAALNIRVNAVCPTALLTPLVEHFIATAPDPAAMRLQMESMNPIPGSPTVEDVAAATLFLASAEARFITGVSLPVDGGYTAR